MAYHVIRRFADMTDRTAEFPNGFEYEVGDSFPRAGCDLDEAWAGKLLTGDNNTGSIFLREGEAPVVEAPQEAKPKGKKTKTKLED